MDSNPFAANSPQQLAQRAANPDRAAFGDQWNPLNQSKPALDFSMGEHGEASPASSASQKARQTWLDSADGQKYQDLYKQGISKGYLPADRPDGGWGWGIRDAFLNPATTAAVGGAFFGPMSAAYGGGTTGAIGAGATIGAAGGYGATGTLKGAATGAALGGATAGVGSYASGAGSTAGTNAGGGINPELASNAMYGTGGYTGEGINPNLASNAFDSSLSGSLPGAAIPANGYTGEGFNATPGATAVFNNPINAALPGAYPTTGGGYGSGGGSGGGGLRAPGAGYNGSGGLNPNKLSTTGLNPSGQGPIGEDAAYPSQDYSLTSGSDAPASASHSPMTTTKAPSMWDSVAPYAKYALPAAGLVSQLLRKPGIPQEGNLNSRYNSQNAAGESDLANARAGNLTPSQQANITKFTTESDSALKQYFANSGQGTDSTGYLESKQKLDQTALAMKQGYVDQMFQQGLAELNLADSAQAQLINIRMQREQNASNAMNSFMMELGMMGAFA